MARHYKIDEEKKIIYADILALTEKEEAEIAKYQKYGYSVEPMANKQSIVRLTKKYILDYLNDEKKAPDIDGKKAPDVFEGKMKEDALDEHGNKKNTKKDGTGKDRKKGYNNALHWFARTYPLETTEIKREITQAGKDKAFSRALKNYNADNAESTNKMNEEEYTRFFYWTKVFVNPNQEREE